MVQKLWSRKKTVTPPPPIDSDKKKRVRSLRERARNCEECTEEDGQPPQKTFNPDP